MSELKSENEINTKNVKPQSHTVSKSSSKKNKNLFYIFFIVNFDINQNIFQLNSNNIFAFPVSIYYFNLFFSNFRKTPNFSMVCRTKKIRISVIHFF